MSDRRVIRNWTLFSKWFGSFYIIKTIWHEGASFEDEFTYEYLHADGTWRDSILNEVGEPTGWHASRAVAEALLATSK